MTSLWIFTGTVVLLLLLLLFGLSRSRMRRLVALVNEKSAVPALTMSISGADHLWLHRSLDDQPTLADLEQLAIETPKDLHKALLSRSAQVSLSKSGQAQRAQRVAEVRARREDLMELVPRLEEAAGAAAPALDVVLLEAIALAPHGLLGDLISADLAAKHGIDLLPFHDSITDGAGAAGEHALHAIADAHIPIVTIATSVHRYYGAVGKGLDRTTAITEGAYEIALKGGGVAAGATIGAHALGTFMPVVGHIVGAGLGALGGWIGSQINAQRQEQPLRDADAALRSELFELGLMVRPDAWERFANEGWEVVEAAQAALEALADELDASLSWWRRHVRPTFLDVAAAEAIRQGQADVAAECEAARMFDELVERMISDGDGQAYLAAAALARPGMRKELGVDDNDFKPVTSSLEAVTAERKRLALLRG